MVKMRERILVVALWSIFGLQSKSVNGVEFVMNEQNLTELPDFPAEVTEIYVDGNFLTNIAPDAFDNITTLLILKANDNQITEFPDLGSQKDHIHIVQLNGNLLSYIEKEKLEGLTSIYSISVGDNKLYELPDISSNPTLWSFVFYRNRIPRVPSNFLPTQNTHSLSLYGSDNPLDVETFLQDIQPVRGMIETCQMNRFASSPTNLPMEKLEGFDQLEVISIGWSDLRRLPDFHHQIQRLKTVNLRSCKIASISYYDLEPFLRNTSDNTKRDQLDLTDNKLQTFPCVKTLKKSLNILNLEHNPLHCDCRLSDLLQEVKNSGNTFPKVNDAPCASPPSLVGVNWNDINLDNLTCQDETPSSVQLREFKKVKVDYKKTGPYLDTLVTESDLGCMRVCIINKNCWSFNFDKKSGQCELIKHSECDFITAYGWEIYDSQ